MGKAFVALRLPLMKRLPVTVSASVFVKVLAKGFKDTRRLVTRDCSQCRNRFQCPFASEMLSGQVWHGRFTGLLAAALDPERVFPPWIGDQIAPVR